MAGNQRQSCGRKDRRTEREQLPKLFEGGSSAERRTIPRKKLEADHGFCTLAIRRFIRRELHGPRKRPASKGSVRGYGCARRRVLARSQLAWARRTQRG